jgi:hypothetical protein
MIQVGIRKDFLTATRVMAVDNAMQIKEARNIEIKRIDGILPEEKVRNKKVLVKIDVQGAELDVMEGLTGLLSHVEVIILEVSFFCFNPPMPVFYDVVAYMHQAGYAVYDIFDGLNRPLDGAPGQRDIMFVREKGYFRKEQTWN